MLMVSKSSNTSNRHTYVETVSHNFVPLNCYICTLPSESFESQHRTWILLKVYIWLLHHILANDICKGIYNLSNETVINIDLLYAYKISAPHSTIITNSTVIQQHRTSPWNKVISPGFNMEVKGLPCKHHRTLLWGSGSLEDYHIGNSQFLIQNQVSKIGGF